MISAVFPPSVHTKHHFLVDKIQIILKLCILEDHTDFKYGASVKLWSRSLFHTCPLLPFQKNNNNGTILLVFLHLFI